MEAETPVVPEMGGQRRRDVAGLNRAELLRAVSDPDAMVRLWACRLLDHHELDAEVANRMVAALSDPNKKVRAAALHTLACEACKPDGSECFPIDVVGVAIQAMRDDRSLRVRRAAAGTLMWRRGPMEPRTRRAFHRVLRDEIDPGLRGRAELALSRADRARAESPVTAHPG
jgi:HEAT repeat protein